jgi:CelD/BcsL family acetyltransferase involved in cellulose biosynthesis
VSRRPGGAGGRHCAGTGDVHMTVRRTLGGYAAAWDALVDRQPLPSPFLRSWWLEAMSVAHPRFLLVLDGVELIGGLAVEETRCLGVTMVRVMGGGPLAPDHLDLVAAPGAEAAVAAALRRWFEGQGPCLVDLAGLASATRLATALPGARVQRDGVAPWGPLPDDPDTYRRARPARLRHSNERARRRLHREGIVHRTVPREEAAASLTRLCGLHTAQHGARSRFVRRFDDAARAALAGMARGEAMVHELGGPQGVIVVQLWFQVAGRLSYYQGGRDLDHRWRGAGAVLMETAIEEGIGRGATEVDLLRGGELYKRELTTRERHLLRVRSAHRLLGRTAFHTQEAMERGRSLAGAGRRRLGRR